MAKKSTKKAKAIQNVDYDKEIDSIEGELDLLSIHMSRQKHVQYAISSGSLTLDLIMGGGFAPGRYTSIFGPEASGKSTLMFNAMCNAASKKIKTFYGDAEGATDPNYLGQIASLYNLALNAIFGRKDEKGKWIDRPLVRHYQPTTGESWFRLMKRSMKNLPDRKATSRGGKKKWIDVFEDGTEEERKNGKVQNVYFMDSLPAFVPEDLDEDDEKNPMSQIARMYSEQFPAAVSLFNRKRCTLIATNQIRQRPMAFGNPEYEPCGEAQKFYSSTRVRVEGLSFSNQKAKAWPKTESTNVYEEKSWDYKEHGGHDRYRLIKASTTKNKVFTPFLTTYFRIWMSSREGTGYGIDPVYDTAQFLRETGQMWKATGKGMQGKFAFAPSTGIKKPLTWMQFKAKILNPKNKGKLRARCFKQLRKGDSFDLYFKQKASE